MTKIQEIIIKGKIRILAREQERIKSNAQSSIDYIQRKKNILIAQLPKKIIWPGVCCTIPFKGRSH